LNITLLLAKDERAFLVRIGESVMESRQAGVFRLCIIMGVFSVSIFFLNNNKKNFITATHIDVLSFKVDPMVTLSLDQAYEAMSSLFLAHDIDLIVKVMSQFKYRFAYDLIEKMIVDEAVCLSYEEKIKIIYGMVAHCGTKKSVQYELLDFLVKYPVLHAHVPSLLSLARSKHADTIALFISWGKDRQKNGGNSNLLSSYAEQAFTVAVHDDDYEAIEVLLSKKVRISPAKSCELLWYIVEQCKSSNVVSLLVRHAQADVNCADNGKTLLIAAVEKNRIDMVRVLLEAGAVVDRVIDGETGTALNVAMKHSYHTVEQLLREYGAA